MRVFWDTNIFVYRFEENGVLSLQASALWERMEARGDILISSVLTLGELLAGTAQSDPNTADMTRRLLLSTTTLIPFDISAAERFAVIRANRSIKAPDAIQLACALVSRCDLFVTNDQLLSRMSVPGIPVISSLQEVPI